MAVCTVLFHGSMGLKAWWCALCAHHQAFKPIEPWNNIIHTTIDSYTGFILSRTHHKHQWLLLQFIKLLMMDANCARNV